MSHTCNTTCWNFSKAGNAISATRVDQEHNSIHPLRYTPLDPAKEEIRLIKLLPARDDYTSYIELELQVVSLKDPPIYNTLSYCWGKGDSPHPIRVSRGNLLIGSELDYILRHLRLVDHVYEQPIWIDAVCINQNDVDERQQQVRLMRNIYASAARVFISLGPGSDGYDPMFKNMRTGTILNTFDNREEGLYIVRLLTIVCSHAWFSRVWVLQEFLLAQKDPHIFLGCDFAPWSQFHDYVMAVVDQGSEYTDKAARDGEETVPWPTDQCRRLRQAAVQLTLLGILKKHGAVTTTIAKQLSRTQFADSTDARDKVFGLLGICQLEDAALLDPDYTRSVEQVFSQVTAVCLAQDRDLIYEELPLRPPRGPLALRLVKRPGLPSWAIDLTLSAPQLGLNLPYRYNQPNKIFANGVLLSDYIAKSNDMAPIVSFSEDHLIMRTAGLHIGTISATSSDLFLSDDQEDWPNFLIPASLIYDLYHDRMRPRAIPWPSLYFALDKNHLENRRRDFERLFGDLVSERIRADDPRVGYGTPHYQLLIVLTLTCRNRILFVTEEGHVGLSYHEDAKAGIRAGDIVTGLFGINVPFILHRIQPQFDADDTAHPEGNDELAKYQMINIAHVAEHSFGHEFIENANVGATWEDFRDFGLREYQIV